MQVVTKRDLNQQTATVLDRVSFTSDVIVTERGKPRWRVSVYRDEDRSLDRLERDGQYTPPAGNPVAWPAEPGGPRYTDAEATALLQEMRGEH